MRNHVQGAEGKAVGRTSRSNGAARTGKVRRKRRRWSVEEKIRIARESLASSETITAVAKRHGVPRNRLSSWRNRLREGKLVLPSSARAHPEAVDLKALPKAHRKPFERQSATLKREQTDNEELRAQVELLTDSNRRLEHLIGELRRAIYDKRSEKRPLNDRQLAFEDLEGAVAEVEEAVAAAGTASASPGRRRRAPRRNLGHLPKDLERIEHVIEPDSTQCPCGCGQMIRIGEDRTERLDIVPAKLRVIVTVRPKYACRSCEQGVLQAAAPAHLIIGGLPTEGALAQVLISKYADHLPLYRQSQIYARSGVELDRSTLAGWVGKASFHLTPVVDRLAWHLKQSDRLFMDETRAPVLDPGRGKTKTGYLWALARDQRPWAGPDPPGVAFFYAPGRGGCHAEGFIEGFQGKLHVDGYAGYNVVAAPGKGVVRCYCWAYVAHRIMLPRGSFVPEDVSSRTFAAT